jgi:16S rRNA pseudouridine516 synthase
MTIRGRPVDPPAPLVLIMHKPLGVVCSHKEDGERIYDLLPKRWQIRDPGLSTVGRLDKDTSGLILITDDGDYPAPGDLAQAPRAQDLSGYAGPAADRL